MGISLFICWNLGTAVGAFRAGLIGDPAAFGIGAAFPASLLAALVATSTFAHGKWLHLDARVVGVGGAIAIWRGASFPLVVLLAAAAAALLRRAGIA